MKKTWCNKAIPLSKRERAVQGFLYVGGELLGGELKRQGVYAYGNTPAEVAAALREIAAEIEQNQ